MENERNPYRGSVVVVRRDARDANRSQAVFVDSEDGHEHELLRWSGSREEAVLQARTFAGWSGITTDVRADS